MESQLADANAKSLRRVLGTIERLKTLIYISFRNPDVKVVASKSQETFYLRKEVLTRSSRFFNNATKWEWLGNGPGIPTIDLTDVRADVVAAYLDWLCNNKQERPKFTKMATVDCKASTEGIALALLYVFGERIMDVKFKNAIMSRLTNRLSEKKRNGRYKFPTSKAATIIWEGTLKKSPAHEFVVKCCSDLNDCPKELADEAFFRGTERAWLWYDVFFEGEEWSGLDEFFEGEE